MSSMEIMASGGERDEQEKKSSPEQALESEQIAQEDEDLRWDTNVKGWFTYWKRRLAAELPSDMPPALDIFIKKAHQIPSKQAQREAIGYVKKRLAATRERRKPTDEETSDPVSQAAKELADQDADRDLAETEILHHRPLPESDEVLRADFKMPTSKTGWVEYWSERLKDEAELLPEKIRTALANEKRTPSDMRTLQTYVNDRHRMISFALAKKDAMKRLRQELRGIDARDDMEPGEIISRRTISFDESSGNLITVTAEGTSRVLTEGDVVGDGIWGIGYRPDATVPHRQWRRLRKLSAIREARGKIEAIWNQELAERESVSLPTSSMTPKFIDEHVKEHSTGGIIAERMAQSLLARIQYDHPDLGIRVESSNALEDAELKYDFKVVMPDRLRGVAMADLKGTREEHVAEKKRLGVQFTVGKGSLAHKREQVAEAKKKIGASGFRKMVKKPVDDIILVRVKMDDINSHYRQWLAKGKPSGGPEQFFPMIDKRSLVESLLKDLPGADRVRVAEMIK